MSIGFSPDSCCDCGRRRLMRDVGRAVDARTSLERRLRSRLSIAICCCFASSAMFKPSLSSSSWSRSLRSLATLTVRRCQHFQAVHVTTAAYLHDQQTRNAFWLLSRVIGLPQSPEKYSAHRRHDTTRSQNQRQCGVLLTCGRSLSPYV